MLKQQRKTLNSYIFWYYLLLNKKIKFRKELFIFFKYLDELLHTFKLVYIFLGLTILGISKTPKTKSNRGAMITKNDSAVINS